MQNLMNRQPFLLLLAGILLVIGFTGCGGTAGPQKAILQGTVTYKGAPVPRGEMQFAPDTSKGNAGPGTSARIENGVYDLKGGMGVVGGPHIVRITGFDGVPDGDNADGKLLFEPYEARVDLPKESGKFDFTVESP
jgi:hypothetical protein